MGSQRSSRHGPNRNIQPNDFFSGDSGDSDPLGNDVNENLIRTGDSPQQYIDGGDDGYDGEIEPFDARLNVLEANFATRVRIYLKPKSGSILLQTFLLLVDTMLG